MQKYLNVTTSKSPFKTKRHTPLSLVHPHLSLSLSLKMVSRRMSVKTHPLIVRKTRRMRIESSRPRRQGNGVTLVCTFLEYHHRSPFIHHPCGKKDRSLPVVSRQTKQIRAVAFEGRGGLASAACSLSFVRRVTKEGGKIN